MTAARNVITGVAQIQDNGNDLEEGGDDFVDINNMLLDELDLSELLRRLLRQSHYDSYCSYDSTTKARPPEGLKGQTAQEEEAEGYWWW
jgi:hypothetical protein